MANTDLRKKIKNDLENFFFLSWGILQFLEKLWKMWEDIKLATAEIRRNYLVLKPNYHITKFFTENLLALEVKKTEICINKPVYLELPILELSKILMYELYIGKII